MLHCVYDILFVGVGAEFLLARHRMNTMSALGNHIFFMLRHGHIVNKHVHTNHNK